MNAMTERVEQRGDMEKQKHFVPHHRSSKTSEWLMHSDMINMQKLEEEIRG